MKTFAFLLASRTPTTGTGERETSLEDRGEVPGRMQNAKHCHARTGSNIEAEIALKACDRHYAHTFEILAPKCPDTAHIW